jgi:hypothetical protein
MHRQRQAKPLKGRQSAASSLQRPARVLATADSYRSQQSPLRPRARLAGRAQ